VPPLLKPRRPEGTARSSMFFDRFPRFYETSHTTAFRDRLNLRYDAIFAENRALFDGARVLDIASHDGRWSLAALETGAKSVVGIEGKEKLVANAQANLAEYIDDESRYTFHTGDVHQVLAAEKIEVDVVMCLGFLYHTLRYNELMRRIRDINPRKVIIDTQVHPRAKAPVVRLTLDKAGMQRDAVADELSYGNLVLTGLPSVPAIRLMARGYGYEVESFSDWGSLLRDNPDATDVGDYARLERVTLVLSPEEDRESVRPAAS
jgi:Methyltransferase domain